MTLIIDVGFWSIKILSMAGWWLEAMATNFPDTSSILCKIYTMFLRQFNNNSIKLIVILNLHDVERIQLIKELKTL